MKTLIVDVHDEQFSIAKCFRQAMLNTDLYSIANMNIWTQEEEAENLAKLLEGVNKAKFARDSKVPGGASMISQHISGNRPISLDAAIAYANGLGLTVADISPRLSQQINKVTQSLSDYNIPTEEEYSLVPQLDIAASCGNGRFAEHVVVKGGLAFKKSFLRKFGLSEDNSRVIYADGQSNEPTIIDGCAVLISLNETSPIDGKFFLIVDPDGAVLLKRLVREYNEKSGGMAWVMRSDNPNKKDYPDKLLPDDERTRIIGRAVWNDNVL